MRVTVSVEIEGKSVQVHNVKAIKSSSLFGQVTMNPAEYVKLVDTSKKASYWVKRDAIGASNSVGDSVHVQKLLATVKDSKNAEINVSLSRRWTKEEKQILKVIENLSQESDSKIIASIVTFLAEHPESSTYIAQFLSNKNKEISEQKRISVDDTNLMKALKRNNNYGNLRKDIRAIIEGDISPTSIERTYERSPSRSNSNYNNNSTPSNNNSTPSEDNSTMHISQIRNPDFITLFLLPDIQKIEDLKIDIENKKEAARHLIHTILNFPLDPSNFQMDEIIAKLSPEALRILQDTVNPSQANDLNAKIQSSFNRILRKAVQTYYQIVKLQIDTNGTPSMQNIDNPRAKEQVQKIAEILQRNIVPISDLKITFGSHATTTIVKEIEAYAVKNYSDDDQTKIKDILNQLPYSRIPLHIPIALPKKKH